MPEIIDPSGRVGSKVGRQILELAFNMLNSKYIASRIRGKNRRVINQLNRGSKPALDSESIPGEVADILVVDRVGRSGVAEFVSHSIKK